MLALRELLETVSTIKIFQADGAPDDALVCKLVLVGDHINLLALMGGESNLHQENSILME